jgi:thiol-disulfide isomerase/thioredoxin
MMKRSKVGGAGPTRGALLGGLTMTLLGAIALPARGEESTVPSNASLETLFESRSWLNGKLSRSDLRGKVVLVDVFTFGCINCQNITPNLRALAARKRDDFAIVGIHTPETPIEHEHSEVVSHLAKLGVTWPVAIDNEFALWNAYHIEYWPTQMLFDRRGKLRKVIIGDSQDTTVDAAVDALLHESA